MSKNSDGQDRQGKVDEVKRVKQFKLKHSQDQTSISLERYVELLFLEEKWYRLEGGGVDNWQGYDLSMFPDDQPTPYEYERSLWLEQIQEYEERSSQD